jgi:hypothetical protein
MYIFLTYSVLNLRVIVFILLSNLIFTQTKNSIKNILIDKEYDSKSFFVGVGLVGLLANRLAGYVGLRGPHGLRGLAVA